MKIVHLAMWVRDLEATRSFYETFFRAKANEKYYNQKKQFSSYFLSFPDNDVKLELMHHATVPELRPAQLSVSPEAQFMGLVHFAVSVGSRAAVDALTETIRNAGYQVISEPRTTGDGYYESVILDPEGNMVEITE